jgi:hypothetical protein
VDSTTTANLARGKLVDVREDADGTVHIEYRGSELPAKAFAKDARVNPGAIVENKLLSHTLRVIETAHRERDENRLESKRLTLRDKDKLRKAMGIAGELHASPKRIKRPPTYPPMQLTAAAPNQAKSRVGWRGPKRNDWNSNAETEVGWHTT